MQILASWGTWQQDALNYFGFKGKYNPQASGSKIVEGNNMYIAYTVNNTGEINIGDLVFPTSSNQFKGGYDRLKMHYYKELFHHNRIISGIQLAQQANVPSELKFYPEERLGYIHLYKNQGLFPNSNRDVLGLIRMMENGYFDLSTPYQVHWYDFIYKIPRRW